MPFRKSQGYTQAIQPGIPLDWGSSLANGLLLWWPMNNGVGAVTVKTVPDLGTLRNSPASVSGTSLPSTWASNTARRALHTIAGSSEMMTTTATTGRNPPWTLSVWVNGYDTNVQWSMMSQGTNNWDGWYFAINGGTLTMTASSNNSFAGSATAAVRGSPQWVHVVLVARGNTNRQAYANLVAGAVDTVSVVPAFGAPYGFAIGGSWHGGLKDNFTTCNFSDLRFWNRALSFDEIQILYNLPTRPLYIPRRRIINGAGTAYRPRLIRWSA